MPKNNKEITEENNFYAKRVISSISRYKECLDEFSKNFEKQATLKTDTVIFLDTNVLLRYYSISFTAREKLFNFLITNHKRIRITTQVQIEFLRNREDIIQRFFEQVTSKIPKDFNTDIVNKMKNFLDQHKIVLKDYSFVEPGIEKFQIELEALLKKLNESVELKKKEHNDLIVKDKLLNFLSTCESTDELTVDEICIIKKHYDLLAKNITPENVDSILNKSNSIFPGLGDIKKSEDPHGDYVIFHEIMKFMINENTDAIFLTFDNTKGDWMNKNKSPHLHYTQNMYENTGKIFYIIDAERAFGELLNINIDSLVSSNVSDSSIPITAETVLQFVIKSSHFVNAEIKTFREGIIEEFKINGYVFIHEIEKDLKKIESGLLEFRKDNQHLSVVGILRAGLRIANPKYTIEVTPNAVKKNINQERLKEYRAYSKL